jgi:hypothetical protein
MVCVLGAAQAAGVPFKAVTLKGIGDGTHLFGVDRSTLIEDRGKPDLSDDTKRLLLSSDEPICSFIGGIKHVQMGLRRIDDPSEPAFDFVLADAPDLPLDPDADVIPSGTMREVVQRTFSSRLRILRRVAKLAPGRVYQFGPPPPVSDHWLETFVLKHAAAPGRLPNRLLRWKLWRLTTDVFRQQAETFGAHFVDGPPEAVDADGFMRDHLVRNVTHGNEAFGALLLAQIRGLR